MVILPSRNTSQGSGCPFALENFLHTQTFLSHLHLLPTDQSGDLFLYKGHGKLSCQQTSSNNLSFTPQKATQASA